MSDDEILENYIKKQFKENGNLVLENPKHKKAISETVGFGFYRLNQISTLLAKELLKETKHLFKK